MSRNLELCDGKNRYPSRKLAATYLSIVKLKRRNRKKKFRIYLCQTCRDWHLTSHTWRKVLEG